MAFKSRNKLEEGEEEFEAETHGQRYIHNWDNTNDGVFAMSIEDFAKYFNLLTICRPIDQTWTQVVYNQSFAPS